MSGIRFSQSLKKVIPYSEKFSTETDNLTFKSFIFEINSFIKKFEYHVKFVTGHKIEWIMMSPNSLDHFLYNYNKKKKCIL